MIWNGKHFSFRRHVNLPKFWSWFRLRALHVRRFPDMAASGDVFRCVFLFIFSIITFNILCKSKNYFHFSLDDELVDECKALNLQDEEDLDDVASTGSSRGQKWLRYLDVELEAETPLQNFNEVFDLPEQSILRKDCAEAVGMCYVNLSIANLCT